MCMHSTRKYEWVNGPNRLYQGLPTFTSQWRRRTSVYVRNLFLYNTELEPDLSLTTYARPKRDNSSLPVGDPKKKMH